MSQTIIIDALWRTCSTYMWEQFRRVSGVRAYYEPFHPSLTTNTHAQYSALHQNVIPSMHAKILGGRNHLNKDKHFWDAYPLKAKGGVEGFEERFALDNYALRPGVDEDPELEAYLLHLKRYARQRGETPVFQFNRSLLRAEWIKSKLPGECFSIHVTRHPGQIFASYMKFPQRDYNFINHMANIVHKNAAHPIFAEFAQQSDLKDDQKAFLQHIDQSTGVFSDNGEQHWKDMVGFFWAIGLVAASRHANLVIDVNAIGHRCKTSHLEDVLRGATGLEDLKLKDFCLPRDNMEFSISPDMQKIIRNAVVYIQPDVKYFHGMQLDRASKKLFVDTLQLDEESASKPDLFGT